MSSKLRFIPADEPCLGDRLCMLETGHSGRHRHKRGCKCRSCVGRRSRRSGRTVQNKVFRDGGGVEAFPGAHLNEETWQGFEWAPGVRFEVKSGASVPKWVTNAIGQVQAGHGDGVRAGLIIKPKGTSQNWVVMRLDDLESECRELMQRDGEMANDPEMRDRIRITVQSHLHAARRELEAAEQSLCSRS